MLSLDKSNASVTNLNIRIEKHGDERQPACDIKIVVDVGAERLDDLHPGLCESLYRKPGRGDQIALIDKKSEAAFTVLRHPCLEPQRLKQKFPGYEMSITEPGLDEDEVLFLPDVEIKNFTIDPHEGGSTTITLTASSPVDEGEIAALLTLLQNEDAVVSLVPPKKQDSADAEDVKQAA